MNGAKLIKPKKPGENKNKQQRKMTSGDNKRKKIQKCHSQ